MDENRNTPKNVWQVGTVVQGEQDPHSMGGGKIATCVFKKMF